MQTNRTKYYPTLIEAVHLLVLYIFLKSLIDFPLALYDYHYDTHWLNNSWIGAVSTITITLFIFIFGFKKAKQPFRVVFGLKMFNPLFILPVLIMLPAMQVLSTYVNEQIVGFLPPPPWFWELFERIFNNRFGFWGTLLKVAVIAPVIEEILFRGIIMNGLMRNYKPWYAILLSGILFSLFHLNPWQMTYTFFLGLLLGWLMVLTKSLPLCILVHSLNNLLVLLSIVFQEKINEHALFDMSRENNIKVGVLLLFAGIFIILLINIYRRQKKPLIEKNQAYG